MKICVATTLLTALCANVAGFVVTTSSVRSNTNLFSSEEKSNRAEEMEKTLQNRLANLEKAEKLLEQKMAGLAQTERTLQQRLGSSSSAPGSNAPPRPNAAAPPSVSAKDGGPSNMRMYEKGLLSVDKIWDSSTPVTIQGGNTLRTWTFANPAVKRVHVLLKTDGRPLDADIQLWQGPDNTPSKLKVYLEDGASRTFSAFIDTPNSPNAIRIRNIGPLEYPLFACVAPDKEVGAACLAATRSVYGETIQGGAIRTYPFGVEVDSVAVLITTNGRPLNARLELLQGPNNNKQVLDFYTEDGLVRPLLLVVQTPGSGNVVRVINRSPVELPLQASVVEYETTDMDPYQSDGIQLGNW